MNLFVVEADIEHSRLLEATGKPARAMQKLDEAERGLRRIGYKRRLPEILDLRRVLVEALPLDEVP
jgi:hypothetical protein